MLLLGCARGWADERAEALQHYAKGKKAFELGAYDEAVAEYSAAYRIKDDPVLLYDLGQAYRLANHPADALRSYRMFLVRVSDAPNRDEVEQKIQELQQVIAAHKNTPAPAPATTQMPAPPPLAGPRTVDIHAARTMKRAGIGTAVAGLAVVAGGITCGVLAQQSSDALTRADQHMQSFSESEQQAGKTEQLLEGVFIGVGAAAALAGGVLALVGARAERRACRVALAPAVGGGLVGGAAQVSF